MAERSPRPPAFPLRIRQLGQQPYLPVWEAMKAFTAARDADTPDELWCLEHEPVYTQGQAGKAEHLLAPGDIPVVQVDRGGQVTYHGPGQLVVYLLIDLPRAGLGVRQLVDIIEQSIVSVLATHGVDSAPRPDAPGVYVDGAKIASLGLRVRRGCSFHGLALNVAMDLTPFGRINPCGFAGMPMCQLQDLAPEVTLASVTGELVAALAERIGYPDTQRIAASGLPDPVS